MRQQKASYKWRVEAAALVKDLRATIKAGEGLAGSVEEEPHRMGNACSFRLLSQLGEAKQGSKGSTKTFTELCIVVDP